MPEDSYEDIHIDHHCHFKTHHFVCLLQIGLHYYKIKEIVIGDLFEPFSEFDTYSL